MSARQEFRRWDACTGDPCTCPKPIDAWREKNATPILRVIGAVMEERRRQDEKWGEQNHPDVPTPRSITTPPDHLARIALGLPSAVSAKMATDTAAAAGRVTWGHIATEELAEAVEAAADGDEDALRTELVQLAAVCVQWAQAIDRRRERREAGQ